MAIVYAYAIGIPKHGVATFRAKQCSNKFHNHPWGESSAEVPAANMQSSLPSKSVITMEFSERCWVL